jgi:hypothetical protein
MLLLPLHQLLQVPIDTLSVVADNAVSPAHPLSASLKINLRRGIPARSISWDGSHSGQNRWSGAVSNESMMLKKPGQGREPRVEQEMKRAQRREETNRRTGARDAPARSHSMDSTFESLCRGQRPARRPRRKLSPEPKQLEAINDRRNVGLDKSYVISSILKRKLTLSSLNAMTPQRAVSPPPLFLSSHEKISAAKLLTDVLEEFDQE